VSSNTWTLLAVSSEVQDWRSSIWRIVEWQHFASTMKIVDNASEQDLLENLLEASKPPIPRDTAGLDYLLATPFRYDPARSGSRFRSATDPGVFYGAGSVRTACAEPGYWRWKFLKDAEDLDKIEPVAHTAFRTDVRTRAVDLRESPFSKDAACWAHPTDYATTQSLARAARKTGIGAIVYHSVRDPQPGWCTAILTPTAFAARKPHSSTQKWLLAVHQDHVIWRREREVFTFQMLAATSPSRPARASRKATRTLKSKPRPSGVEPKAD